MKNLLDPVTKIDLDEAFEEYGEKNRGYKDEILTGRDKVMKELETMREENVVGAFQIRELHEKFDVHEKRIKKLEKPAQ